MKCPQSKSDGGSWGLKTTQRYTAAETERDEVTGCAVEGDGEEDHLVGGCRNHWGDGSDDEEVAGAVGVGWLLAWWPAFSTALRSFSDPGLATLAGGGVAAHHVEAIAYRHVAIQMLIDGDRTACQRTAKPALLQLPTALQNGYCREIPGLLQVKPEGGKISRASSVSPLIEAGNIYLPHPQWAPWMNDFRNAPRFQMARMTTRWTR
jgi:hypothetical protein